MASQVPRQPEQPASQIPAFVVQVCCSADAVLRQPCEQVVSEPQLVTQLTAVF